MYVAKLVPELIPELIPEGGPNREGVLVIVLQCISAFLASCAVLFAVEGVQSASASLDMERWIGPIMTSVTSLMGSIFAFMTAREIRRDDSEKRFQKSELDRAVRDNQECREDRARLHSELIKSNRKIARVMRKIDMEDDAEEDDKDDTKGKPVQE